MTITVHVPDSLLENLGETPEELRREILRVAAIHLYSRGLVSQGRDPAHTAAAAADTQTQTESGTGPILVNWAAPPTFERSSLGRGILGSWGQTDFLVNSANQLKISLTSRQESSSGRKLEWTETGTRLVLTAIRCSGARAN